MGVLLKQATDTLSSLMFRWGHCHRQVDEIGTFAAQTVFLYTPLGH